jgi:hypothetical protein
VNDGGNETGREATHDFVHVHKFASGCKVFTKRTRVRVFEGDGLPIVVLSSPENPVECTVPDIERIAAEVMLGLYPSRALLARSRTPWFELIEHLPKSYDRVHWPASEHRWRDNLHEVKFTNYRITLGGFSPVLRPGRALRENTRARYGVRRLTFGYPEWGPRLTLEEVEGRVGARLAGAFDKTPEGQT